MTNPLIDQLRKEVEAKYRDALAALNELERFLSVRLDDVQRHASNVKIRGPRPLRSLILDDDFASHQSDIPMLPVVAKPTNRQAVLRALAKSPGADLEELCKATGLPKDKVRGVLYAPKLTSHIKKEVDEGGRAKYWLDEGLLPRITQVN